MKFGCLAEALVLPLAKYWWMAQGGPGSSSWSLFLGGAALGAGLAAGLVYGGLCYYQQAPPASPGDKKRNRWKSRLQRCVAVQ